VVALGCLLRGETLHFELLAEACTRGLELATARHGVAIAHGVLACENRDQALERSAPGSANKGREAAAAAVETATILRRLRAAGQP
jgi:6,7-dimethyl-8-ribityllumazine synthase